MGFAYSAFTCCPDVQTLSGPPWKNISKGGCCFFFFSPWFISNYSCFHLNIKNGKGTEAYSYDNCSSGLSGTTSSLLLPLIFFSLGYPGAVTGYSSSLPGSTAFLSSCWAAPEVDKKVRHWVLVAGASRNFRECGTGGKTSILGIHEGWKFICAGAYRSMCSGLSCVYVCLCGPSTRSKLAAMCVSACLCVYNNELM